MGRKSKVLSEIKLKVVEEYITGVKSMTQIAYELQISYSTIQDWVTKYKIFGVPGLITETSNTCYSAKIRTQAITDYFNGKGSLREICIRYNISSHSILRRWIKQHNCDKIFSSCHNKGAAIMTTGRKTTYDERVEIVAFCIANANDYNLTSNKYKVSYQQVYGWIKKYNTNGYAALVDRRGKHKIYDELNESEKYAIQLKLLEAENKRLKMENDLLKKLEEIERR
ncbi:transposase [Clostridium botulinum]|uniref:helix-turn-helix domain-containing protein n=1 Tax=Clostridium botulinum TaxID=1491 RepID=UPI0019684302|nr:helix-turn-helix domain-containing protein [Clostridium botulinum]MBN1061393.1 transposase [Clostridium botulinum]MBN1070758.1 transposase [Clostridium botulinum]